MHPGSPLLAVALLLAPVPAVPESFHTIELRHRPAAEVLPLVRPLLPAGEGASGSGFLLFVRTDPRRLAEIERLVATLDVATRNLTITVRRGNVREMAATEHGASARRAIGDRTTICLPGRTEPGVGVRTGDQTVTYWAQASTRTGDRGLIQTLRVQDGQRAYVRIGQSIPQVQRILALGGRSAVLARGIVFENATSGFEVLPRARGDTVHLEITPRLTTVPTPDGVVSFQELRTTVTARLGEWINLGKMSAFASKVHREILSAGRADARERNTVWLRVD